MAYHFEEDRKPYVSDKQNNTDHSEAFRKEVESEKPMKLIWCDRQPEHEICKKAEPEILDLSEFPIFSNR